MLTIKDIARIAGVGVSTVSRTLNNHPDVNEKTKQKILDIIKQYNYSPNTNAKILKQNVTNNIGIIVKGSFNPFFESIIERMQQDLKKQKYNALVTYIDERSDEIKEAIQLNKDKKLEGIIFLGGSADRFGSELPKLHIPCVVSTVFVPFSPDDMNACVCVDDRLASEKAVNYLISLGHKKIAIIGGKRGNHDGIDLRYTGAVNCIQKNGLHFDQRYYVESKFLLAESYKAMSKLLVPHLSATAVFAMSDIMAIGAAKAITDAGLKVPEDISIIGFDGIDISYFYNPSLATIKQPSKEIAQKSVEVLVRRIRGEEVVSNQILLETQLVKGNSVRNMSASRA